MMKSKRILIAFFALMLTANVHVKAQCVSFVKDNCLPKLEGYIYNGQFNSVVLNQGESAELLITLYSGQEYRVVVCSEEQLGQIHFQIMDINRNMLFDNAMHGYTMLRDISTFSTQQLIVNIEVPFGDAQNIKSGCIAMLVGFREME